MTGNHRSAMIKSVVELLAILLLGALFLAWFPWIMRNSKFGAPFVPAEPEVVKRMLAMAEVKKGDVFYDLGSGDGRIVIAAALKGAQAYGLEIDLLRVLYSSFWIRLLRLHKKAKIIHKDFFKANFSKADVISLFLLQETNDKLQKKLKKELKKGARVVSYGFTFKDWQPKNTSFQQGTHGSIYLYQK